MSENTFNPSPVQSLAGNLYGYDSNPPYAPSDFLAYYPQFSSVPEIVLTDIIAMVNHVVFYNRFGVGYWKMCMGWLTAHYVTLYLRTYRSAADAAIASNADIADDGAAQGLLTAEVLEDVKFQYDHKLTTDPTWGSYNNTEYGKQYIAIAKLLGKGGIWV